MKKIENDILILDWLLSQKRIIDINRYTSLAHWKNSHDRETNMWSKPVDRAIAGGFLADRPGYAFAAGFRCAIQSLIPSLPKDAVAALCVTEEGGGHPRNILTTLKLINEKKNKNHKFLLNGKKQFITYASDANIFFVAASIGINENGTNKLRLVKVARDSSGVSVIPMEDLPFLNEISHGRLRLKNVVVEESHLLPGDGYDLYIKPFRTIEDLHISAAILGYLFCAARCYGWSLEIKEEIISLIITIRTLTLSDHNSPAVHIAMGGFFTQMSRFVRQINPLWLNVNEEVSKLWNRDMVLLNMASAARKNRLASAWEKYSCTRISQ